MKFPFNDFAFEYVFYKCLFIRTGELLKGIDTVCWPVVTPITWIFGSYKSI